MGEQDHKVAIITGGSHGIGAGLVAAYRGRGWAVVASSRAIKPSADRDLLAVEGDISEPATADRIIGEALGRFGRIDTLINNAGVFISKPFTDYTAEDYAALVGVNLTGFFWLTRRAIAEMLKRGSGHVVNITTTLADYADSSTPSVLTALTKGGLASATRSLAIEYASRGIRVNAVAPGVIQTPGNAPGHRVRLPRHPGQRRRAGRHPDAGERAGILRRARRASAPRAGRAGQRHRRRHPVPGVIAVHHRRDPAHRRRPGRRPLTGRPA